MMIFQLSLLATLSVVIFLPSQCASQVTLTQKSAEVKLDGSESMELVCSVNGSISNTRVWTGGPGFQPIITNGFSSDSSKYTETLQTADFSLHVHNVIVDDVCGVNFKCSNGFDNSEPVTIVLNSSIFIYVPIASEIQFKEEYDDTMKMTVFINLTTVFPEPTCTAERGTTVITSQLQSNSYNNGNCGLKTTELRITNETYDCSGQVVITCNVGSQSIVVFTGNSPCPTTQTSMESFVGGLTTSNFNIELSSSTPINMGELIPTSDVIVSLESPYNTNTVILAYNSTDSLSMQTLDQSIKTISASQTIQATSVWNTSKSSRTDFFFQESSGLLVTSLEASILLYDSFSLQSQNQTNFLSVETQFHKVLFESPTTQSIISFTNTDGVPISLQTTYSSKSARDNYPLTVYPSSGLLRTDLFVQNSEVGLSVSKFEITNPVHLSTFSTYLESGFRDEITTTLIATNSYVLTEFSLSNTLVNDSFMQHNTNRQSVTTPDPFIASISSSDFVKVKKLEDSESYFSNFSPILSTYSSYQYVPDVFERPMNTSNDPSYLLETITLTESVHTMTNVRDGEISTGEMETSLNTTTLMSDYLIMNSQSEIFGYFVTTIQADMKSSALEIDVSHTKTSSNLRYSILHTSAFRTFIHDTLQSVVSSHVDSYSVMQSYWHYESPGIELMSTYFKTSSQTTENLHSSEISYYISSETPTVSKDIFTRMTKNERHLGTMNLSISAIQTRIPSGQSTDSSRMKIKFGIKTFGTLSRSEYIEPGTSLFTYTTSDIFAPSVAPASVISSTSAYLTSTAKQNVISEQTKDFIVISTATSIICFSVLILLILLFAKKYFQKSKRTTYNKADQIDWTNNIQLHDNRDKKVSSDGFYTADSSIFTRLNTKWYSYASAYQHNWDDIQAFTVDERVS